MGLGFLQFQNKGRGRVTGLYAPTPNSYPNPTQMQKGHVFVFVEGVDDDMSCYLV